MIKVNVSEQKTKIKKRFPKLMNSKITGNIVFFEKHGVGTVIHLGERNDDAWVMGEHSDDFDMTTFTDYNEPVTLQNA